jgi:hypothetical protein
MDYVPPALPELREIRSFEQVRDAVSRIMQYLQQLQASDMAYFTHLRENLNAAATTEGDVDIAAAPTIRPTRFMNVVTGTDTVTTVVPPRNFVGQMMLVSKDGFFLASGGNISMFQSPNYLNPTAHIMLTWIPSLAIWVADTCRLHTTATTLGVNGRNVLTEPPTAQMFSSGSYLRIGKFVLASLTGITPSVALPTDSPVASGPSWGGSVFRYKGIALSGGYSQLSLEADGGTTAVYLIESGSNSPSQPVQDIQLDSTAEWQGTIWYWAQ